MEDGFDNLNRRIDDTNQRVDGCLTSINRRIDHLQSDIREIRTMLFETLKALNPAD